MLSNSPARLAMAAVMCAAFVFGLLSPADAIPVFARKYGFACTMCHSHFPRLNDFGARYRQNGYQLPGREKEEKTTMDVSAPFAVRTSLGYNSDKYKNTPDIEDVNQFQLNGLDILSGGLLGRNIGYFLVYPPEIKGSRGVVAQDGKLEKANVIFTNLRSRPINLRVGRFEGAFTAFSAERRLTVSPYEIYDFSFPSGVAFGDTQNGIELTGRFAGSYRYAVGWVDGSANNEDDDAPSDFYLRAAKVFGRGEGQNVGHRLGLTGYFGKARPHPYAPFGPRKSFNRWGVDANLNFSQMNVELQYLRGSDDKTLAGSPSDFDFSGGFVQVNYGPSTSLVGFARFDWVNTPGFSDVGDITRWTMGGRYYLQDHIALHVEYSRRNEDSTEFGVGDARENFFTARLDFAF